MKLYTFQIPQAAREGRLLPYAKRMLPEVPESVLREAFRKRDVKVNGRRVGMDEPLLPGAEVRIYARETQEKEIPILYLDDRVLVAVKPAGVSCERDAKGGRTLPELLHAQLLKQHPDAREPLLCHRLDNPTEGLLVLARTPETQQLLQDAFRERRVHKEYTCLVRGTPLPAHRVLTAWLVKDVEAARVRVLDRAAPGAKEICTEYTVLEAGETARLRVQLHTGRTHQIRAHMAHIGHPLLGDDQYGDRAFNKSHKCRSLRLCSTALCFELTGEMAYLNEKQFRCQPSF